jgi:hypothetical protein
LGVEEACGKEKQEEANPNRGEKNMLPGPMIHRFVLLWYFGIKPSIY